MFTLICCPYCVKPICDFILVVFDWCAWIWPCDLLVLHVREMLCSSNVIINPIGCHRTDSEKMDDAHCKTCCFMISAFQSMCVQSEICNGSISKRHMLRSLPPKCEHTDIGIVHFLIVNSIVLMWLQHVDMIWGLQSLIQKFLFGTCVPRCPSTPWHVWAYSIYIASLLD